MCFDRKSSIIDGDVIDKDHGPQIIDDFHIKHIV